MISARWVSGEELERLAKWVSERIPGNPDFWDCQGLSIKTDGVLIGGVIYVNQRDNDIEMNVAADSARFMNKMVLREAFSYPFVQLGCNRITSIVSANNPHALEFNKRLGFQVEGRCREAFGDHDAIIFGMLKRECRWING